MAQATSVDDVFARLEADGFFLRVDATVRPTMSRGAILGEGELALLRQIGDVVRRGHVRRIERERIWFDDGSLATSPDTLHVHCAAVGLARPAVRPIFEADRVTLQPSQCTWTGASTRVEGTGAASAAGSVLTRGRRGP